MILDEIAAKTRIRVEELKRKVSLDEIKAQARTCNKDTGYLFYQALATEPLSFICEVKKASPSKGVIAEDFPYVQIAREYEEAGASAISCLTEPYYFQGSNQYLTEITQACSIPVLRKDFTIDEYQIYEAKVIGASAVLLICALLDKEIIKQYIEIAEDLGLSALVEAHDEKEVKDAIWAGAKIIGVNNRDLRNFTVDLNNSIQLRKKIPKEILFVSESGIKTAADIQVLKENGTNAVLIGETLMRSKNKKAEILKLNGEAYGEN